MIVALPFPATFEDLAKVEGKAELIGGRIIQYMATGRLPSRISKRILLALDQYAEATNWGEAFGDNLGYIFDPPLTSGRQSFSPDCSLFTGPITDDMGFIPGAPTFAVEIRSENDYGPVQDREYEAKRADYFEAGTLVVWDVDPIAKTITSYTKAKPKKPVVFHIGDLADAEPAVPGWQLSVQGLFQ